MPTLKPTKGVLLIAEPSILTDVSFNRSVVLLAEVNDAGAVGFILNKPLEFTLNDLIPEIDSDITVYKGGPVEQDNLYFIHKIPELIPDSVEIASGIYWGGDFDAVMKLLEAGKISHEDIRFFLGYSGWASEQLDEELQINSWIVMKNPYDNGVIGMSYQNFWKEKMIEFGDDYALWSNAPENPHYN
ncbi:YqgE/AlgH family protein [Gilvibacter sediminis]|uniref:YqgE/AlgH family protein n=1 Tax=Gilvibacter sediminis TaxID=379071 RepID=UPI00235019D7|nr:YqgE/AlgH family protein [Gilvibacter sediminis]MDC7998176.1 YqgE/AlgH family protein [Gilvibacter sediminis]